MTKNPIRNFCIIAHIDHGKSTLADRLLEATGTLSSYEMKDQVLDSMDLERERGITIKMHPVTMEYTRPNGEVYTLNLIDTPGHVDFTYEVSRSLAACEGALLVVDAAQGVEAQTVSNLYLAIENDLEIIPVINKIDLPNIDIDAIKHQIIDLLGCKESEIILASAKAGTGIPDILEAVVERIPAPTPATDKPTRALIFDSVFNAYRGAIAYVRVVEGSITAGQKIKFFSTGKVFEAQEVGILRMKQIRQDVLHAGEVGYVIAGAKDVKDTKVGDTITTEDHPALEPLPGYREVLPMVFSGLFPSIAENYEELRAALEKLKLNDSALWYEPETSLALGFGFRCGFLGLLHMEIVQERLEREYDLDLVTTVPNVEYHVFTNKGTQLVMDNPANLPSPNDIDHVEEPYIKASIVTPAEYIGAIMSLAMERRGTYINTEYVDKSRVNMHYEFPLSEVIFDFYDKLKSVTRGYASFDYEFTGFREGPVVKLDILLNGESVDALSTIVHRDKAYEWGRRVCEKLSELIPRQQFEVAIQAAIGSKVIARETVRAVRKNVTAKCYGGDITRKRKLLEKQKEGKKRMKQLGRVEVPQEAFLAILKS
ncbi:MAG TPA: translation elongation factor 4 [bacterium]|nr:translation elongation factor 4 [bacterium]HQI49073.1 translation elongation factor 4 [bacterium]HQJ63495.1 translation elongation factor 4 [bacterium]